MALSLCARRSSTAFEFRLHQFSSIMESGQNMHNLQMYG